MAKVLSNITQKSFMHKVSSKDSLFEQDKFVLFHLMDEIPFDHPHTIYINIKTLGGVNKIYYVAFINKLLWEYQDFHFFKRMDNDSK